MTRIPDAAFWRCAGLPAVTLPASLTSIGNGSFGGCEGLTSVTIPGGVTEIGDMAFYNCPALTLSVYPGSTAETYAKENDIPYALLAAPAPSYGDIDEDGALSIMDVILINKSLLGGATLSAVAKANADDAKSGEIDTTDALNVLKAVVKLVTLPVKS